MQDCYAVVGRQGFDDTYVEAPNIAAVWASVSGAGKNGDVAVDTTTASASAGDQHEVWFGVRSFNEIILAGTYTANIVYTVTANPIAPPELSGCDNANELASPVSAVTFSQIEYNLPNRADIAPGTYDVYVTNEGGTDMLEDAFTYSRIQNTVAC